MAIGPSDTRPDDDLRVEASNRDTPPTMMGKFSFFYTSLEGMRRLSGSEKGFGGDLRYGMPTGIEGADKICQTLAAGEGFGHKTWKAFLSILRGPDGQPVHAIDRVGEGPWHDRRERLIAMNKAGLIPPMGNRPLGDSAAVNDLPDEKGRGRPSGSMNDTHDVVTGSNNGGRLRYAGNFAATCNDWTSKTVQSTTIGIGHAWPASGSGQHWIQAHNASSCAAGVNLTFSSPSGGPSIGGGGGWGGFYCFAI
jgi:hypothetical protein